MPKTLEEVVVPIGRQIHEFVKAGRYNPAAELAYQEFGFKRAFKIYLNAGRLKEAKEFARKIGLLAEFDYLCHEQKYKVRTRGPTGPPFSSKRSEKKVERGLETEVEL